MLSIAERGVETTNFLSGLPRVIKIQENVRFFEKLPLKSGKCQEIKVKCHEKWAQGSILPFWPWVSATILFFVKKIFDRNKHVF